MLSSTAIIRSIKKVLQEFKSKQKYYSSPFQLIVDPVMVSSNNDRLLEESAITELISFMSMADIITPNLPEAELILDYTPNTLDTIDKMKTATLALHNKFDATVLLKGGHLANTKKNNRDNRDNKNVIDLYYTGTGEIEVLTNPFIKTKNTHGTGCTLSAAIAACLAQLSDPSNSEKTLVAVLKARSYLQKAIEKAPQLGTGTGPLNHFWNTNKY